MATLRSPIPYVVGQWVRGPAFYGRSALIHEILDGPRNSIWLLGTRRIGKTSILKQLERIADERYLPVFWDFQGAEDVGELSLTFDDALLDIEDRLVRSGIDLGEIRADDLFVTMKRLVRKVRSQGKSLLILCDEVEELIRLGQNDAGILSKLRRAVHGQEGIRSVFASTVRLWALAEQRGDTSPFLHGVTPPMYIQRLAEDEARSLAMQTQLDDDERPSIEADVVEEILTHCDRHPYLMQLLCKRYLEGGDLEDAIESVASDRMVAHFFSVDFDLLDQKERDILSVISREESSTSEAIATRLGEDRTSLTGELERLANLGFLRRGEARQYTLANFFFRRWISDSHDGSGTPGTTSSISSAGVESPSETPRNPWPLGRITDRYQLVERIGQGASSVVYRAYDEVLENDVAIKVFRHEYSAKGEGLERLRQEVRLARDIGHPNVLRLYDVGTWRDQIYVTMQWIAGSTLADEIDRSAPFEEGRIIGIAARLSSALAAAHESGVLHRDVKPGNILLDEKGTPFLADFGLARAIGGPGITSHGKFVGTPYYCSPEQANLRPLDERSDIYSLGVVIYEMATGQRPFEGSDRFEVLEKHRSVTAPDPRNLCDALSKRFSDLVLRCLDKKPEQRFSSAAALESALREIAPSREVG